MFLTPPDAISQTLLAVPMWLLFELGLLFSRLFVRKAETDPNNLIEQEHERGN
jgi:sec-independent protein translocase protein TatC